MPKSEPLEVADTSNLTDADWREINKLKAAYDRGGQEALSRALEELSADPLRCVKVIGAFFPDAVMESIKDATAEQGITREDL
jgi:hypothetical protein